jgi:hypothetical protein
METTSQSKPLWPIVIGGVFLILVFVIVAKLLTAMSPAVAPEDAARIEERTKAREDLDAENKQKLGTYAWVDKAKGSVQIPIDQAKLLVIAEMQGVVPTVAGPINPPAAAAAPETAPAPAEGAAPVEGVAPTAPAEGAPAATPTPQPAQAQ